MIPPYLSFDESSWHGIKRQVGTLLIPEANPEQRARERVETVEKMMKIIGAKWKPAIMYCLIHNRKMRFGELRRAIPDVTQRILTLRLRELEHDGFVKRTVVNAIPSHVEYEPTDLGDEIHPFYRDLCLWAEERQDRLAPALGG